MSLEDILLEQGRRSYRAFEISDIECSMVTMVEYIDEQSRRIATLEDLVHELQTRVRS